MSRIDKNYPTDKGSKKYPESKVPTDKKWPGRKYPHLPGGTIGEKSI